MSDTFKIHLSRPWLTNDDKRAVKRVLDSPRQANGPEIEALEAEFAKRHGYGHAVAVSSGMAGLLMMTKLLAPRSPRCTT